MELGAERKIDPGPEFPAPGIKRNIVLRSADHLTPFSYTFNITNYITAPKVIHMAPFLLLEQPTQSGKISFYSDHQKDTLHIQFAENGRITPGRRFKIYNSLNKLIYAKLITSNVESVNLEHFSNGLYYLQISHKKKRA
jgi:hypothetical protein